MNETEPYWWTGPICGLGNRLIALAAVRACINEQVLYFPWSEDPSCPGAYEDILEPMDNLQPRHARARGWPVLQTHGWEPLQIYAELKEALALDLSLADFCKKLVLELRGLPFKEALSARALEWRNSKGDAPLVGVHIRRTDRSALHRDQFRAFLMRKQGLNRELPIYLSALYGIFPSDFMSFYENVALVCALFSYKGEHEDFRYAVFSDSEQEISGFEKTAARAGIKNELRLTQSPAQESGVSMKAQVLRQTTIQDAVIDLLCLSQCDAIAQSNRASTFSLVASIIGAKPIITPKTRYPFWLSVEENTALSPSDPTFSERNAA